jgi:hypothetical protein
LYFKMFANLRICLTKSDKATQLWVDMYDSRHTLFIFKYSFNFSIVVYFKARNR